MRFSESDSEDTLEECSMSLTLQSIHLYDATYDGDGAEEIRAILDWFSRAEIVPNIQCLTFSGIALHNADQLSTFLHRIAGSLIDLDIDLVSGDELDTGPSFLTIHALERRITHEKSTDFSQHIDLSVLFRLQTIHLSHMIGEQEDGWVYDLLSQLGPSIEMIELIITESHFPTMEWIHLDWDRIGHILEHQNFPSIRQFRILGRPLPEIQIITNELADYHRRGILTFGFD